MMRSLDDKQDVYIRRAAILDPEEEAGDEEWCKDVCVHSYVKDEDIPAGERYLKAFSSVAREIRERLDSFYNGEYTRKYPERKRMFSLEEYYGYDGKTYRRVFSVVKEGSVLCFGKLVDPYTGEADGEYEKFCTFSHELLKLGEDAIPVKKAVPILSDRDIMSEVTDMLYRQKITDGVFPVVRQKDALSVPFTYREKEYEIILRERGKDFTIINDDKIGDRYGIVMFQYMGDVFEAMYTTGASSGRPDRLFLFFRDIDKDAFSIPDLEKRLLDAGVGRF